MKILTISLVVLCINAIGVWSGNVGRSTKEEVTQNLEVDTQETLCWYNDHSLPIEIFQIFRGWRCYQQTFPEEETFKAQVCSAKSHDGNFYQVPCFTTEEKVFSFDLQSDDTLLKIRLSHGNESETNIWDCYWEGITVCFGDQKAGVGPKLRDAEEVPPLPVVEQCLGEERIQFYIAFLSISLILGIPAALFLAFCCWNGSESKLLEYHRNTLAAVVFRSFFSLLITTEVIRPGGSSPILENGPGCKALAFFEVLSMDLLLTFWLNTSVFLHMYVQEGLEKEPTATKSNYSIAGTAIIMSVIWVIVTATTQDSNCWIGAERSWIQWLRVAILILQLILLGKVVWVMVTQMRAVQDDTARRIRRVGMSTFFITLVFLVQYCLSATAPEYPTCNNDFVYSMYFFDGVQGTLIALLFCYFDPDVHKVVKSIYGRSPRPSEAFSNISGNNERQISTIDAIVNRKTREVQPRRDAEEDAEQMRDVKYSSVVRPQQFQKTIGLMNRLNVAPQASVSVVDGEAYVACNTPGVDRKISLISQYYDIESATDVDSVDGSNATSMHRFHDPLASQTSLNVFHDVDTPFHQIDTKPNDAEATLPSLEVETGTKPKLKRAYKSKYMVEDSDTISTISDSSESDDTYRDSFQSNTIRRKVEVNDIQRNVAPSTNRTDTPARESVNSEYSTTSLTELPATPTITLTTPQLEDIQDMRTKNKPQIIPRKRKERMLVEHFVETTAVDIPQRFVTAGDSSEDESLAIPRRMSETIADNTPQSFVTAEVVDTSEDESPMEGKNKDMPRRVSESSSTNSDTEIEEIQREISSMLAQKLKQTPLQGSEQVTKPENDASADSTGTDNEDSTTPVFELYKPVFKEPENKDTYDTSDDETSRDSLKRLQGVEDLSQIGLESPLIKVETDPQNNGIESQAYYSQPDKVIEPSTNNKDFDIKTSLDNIGDRKSLESASEPEMAEANTTDTDTHNSDSEDTIQRKNPPLLEDIKVHDKDGTTSSSDSDSGGSDTPDNRTKLAEGVQEVKQCVPVQKDDESSSDSSSEDKDVVQEVVEIRPKTDLPSIYDDLKTHPPRRPHSSYGDKKTVYSNMWSKYRNKLITEMKDKEESNTWPRRNQNRAMGEHQAAGSVKSSESSTSSEDEEEVAGKGHRSLPTMPIQTPQHEQDWEPQKLHH